MSRRRVGLRLPDENASSLPALTMVTFDRYSVPMSRALRSSHPRRRLATIALVACATALALVLTVAAQEWALAATSPDTAFEGSAPIVPYIIGGQESSISQFPWQVFVLLNEGHGELGSCGGSILDTTHVLTAAHCVDHEGATMSYPASDLTVIAGASEVLLSSDEARPASSQIVEVKSFRTHPYYMVLPNIKDDVAVLELAEPLELSPSKNTQAISLVPANATPAPGTTLSISGYGKEEGAEGPTHHPDGKLYSTTLIALSSDACRNSVGANSAVLLCAESPSSATCKGDSGGPLTEGSPAVQVGIVDFGPKECPVGQPDGFTNIAAPEVRDFIEGDESPPVAPRQTSPPVIKWFGSSPVAFLPLTCESGGWSGSPSLAYTFQVENASAQMLQSGPANAFAPLGSLVGSTVVCVVQASNAGGTSTGRSPVTPAIAPDTTPPNAAIRGLKCHLQSCVLSFAAWDPNGVAVSVQPTVAYSVLAKCPKKKSRKASKRRVCHTTRTLRMSPKTLSAGSFRATASRLPYGEKLTFAVAVASAAGLKARTATAHTRLRRPRPKKH
jgi:secreted trypsin-like serine protease